MFFQSFIWLGHFQSQQTWWKGNIQSHTCILQLSQSFSIMSWISSGASTKMHRIYTAKLATYPKRSCQMFFTFPIKYCLIEACWDLISWTLYILDGWRRFGVWLACYDKIPVLEIPSQQLQMSQKLYGIRNYWLHKNFICCMVWIQSMGLQNLLNHRRQCENLNTDKVEKLLWPRYLGLVLRHARSLPKTQSSACMGGISHAQRTTQIISKKDVKLIWGNRMTGRECALMCKRARVHEGVHWLYVQFWSTVLKATDK